ncbi:MAG: mercury transporter [Gemmatimonadales bacterium]|nr:mercury transporter [Gemmatimonadales bacterium]
MPPPIGKTLLAAGAGVAAAVGSALCCAGPLVAVFLGLSGAGLAAAFEPLRPYFVAATTLFLLLGFVAVRREERKACQPGQLCASPTIRRRMNRLLWIATAMAVLLVTFPWWSGFILG